MNVRKACLLCSVLGVLSTVVASAQTRGPSGVEEVAPISSSGSRVALVMGNADYPGSGKLANPVNDATDMAAVLKGCGFKVELVTDADLSEMRGALDRFFASVPKDGVALVYYAGHGVEVEKKNYLIPVSDPPLKYESQVPDMALALDEVLVRLGYARAALNIVILDACRNNPLIKELPDGTRSQGGGGLEVVRAAEGTLVAYATQPGNVSSDGPGARNGVYTAELLRLLEEPGWDLLGLFNQVGVAVSKKTKKVQSPWMSNSPIEGHFYFRPDEDETTETGPRTSFPLDDSATGGEEVYEQGLKYADGLGVPEDDGKAVRCFQIAAEHGNDMAMVQLGLMYDNGHGVAEDDEQAVKWYRKAADAGNASGMNNLGAMYASGKGVRRDSEEARQWYHKAAEAGNDSGMYNLGSMCESVGDRVEAVRWYREAAALGNTSAKRELASLGVRDF